MNGMPISRSVRHWQWVALLVSLLPQFDRLPPWLLLATALACLWRLEPVEKRIGIPPLWMRVLLLAAGIAGVRATHHTLLGPEGGVSFLIVAALLKLLESRTGRDAFISAVLDFFVLATAFLFSQSLGLTVYVLVASVVIVSALLSLQQRDDVGVKRTLRRSLVLVGQAVPLMLVLFVFFPRLPPLWTLNLTQGSARTGFSDSMSPGDISTLSESTETAFRVEFQGPPPPSERLYWRGLVFGYFDGKRWSQGYPLIEQIPLPSRGFPEWVGGADPAGPPPLRYRIILEPTDQPWLFTLALLEQGRIGRHDFVDQLIRLGDCSSGVIDKAGLDGCPAIGKSHPLRALQRSDFKTLAPLGPKFEHALCLARVSFLTHHAVVLWSETLSQHPAAPLARVEPARNRS